MLIEVILLLILLCSIGCLFYIFKNIKKDFHTNLLIISLVLIFINALHALIYEYFLLHIEYAKITLPYGLAYGPLFYFIILGLQESKIKFYIYLTHLIPFLIFVVLHVVFLLNDSFRVTYTNLYIKFLYSTIPLSFVIYVIASIVQKQKFAHLDSFIEIKEFLITIRLLLLFIAIFFYVVQSTGGKELGVARLIVYSNMLGSVIYIFIYILRKRRKNIIFSTQIVPNLKQYSAENKYTKVKISKIQLDEYEEKLYRLMTKSDVFLNTDLSLTSLSKELKIPKYHLTQLFSLRIGKNFNQFINCYRINFACDLLSQNKGIKIEEIIYQCGFNSKSSFNRHFKAIVGITPSEYYSEKKMIN